MPQEPSPREEMRADLVELQEENRLLIQELQKIYGSRSWKITKPFRMATRFARTTKNVFSVWFGSAPESRNIRYAWAQRAYHRSPLPQGLKNMLRNPAKRILQKEYLAEYAEIIKQEKELLRK